MRNLNLFVGATTVSLILGIGAIYQLGTVECYDIEVKSKERVSTGSGDSLTHTYLVFTEQGKVFKNSDSLWHWKWDSSTLQGNLEEKGTYRVKTYGWRVPFFSMYENIVEAEDQ